MKASLRAFSSAVGAFLLVSSAAAPIGAPRAAADPAAQVQRARPPVDAKRLGTILPVRVPVAAIGPSRGPVNAPVQIVEFADFQCPFSARLRPTLEQVRWKYGDKVRLVFRQNPLPFRAQAAKAAEASLCAHEQGKFWEMHDALFENQQSLGIDDLKAKAAVLGLHADAFNRALDSGKYAAAVQADAQAARQAGVTGTPAIFINGRFLSGAVPFEQITVVVDDELRRLGR